MTSKLTREENVQAVFDLKAGYTLGLADVEILKRVARMALAAMDSEPNRNPVLAYADSYRDMAKQGVESVPIWSVITDLERNIAPLYRHAQQPVVPGKWIPVSEQMPEDRTQVILWDAEIGEVTSGHYSHKTHTFYHCGDAIENEITHWMPPPCAPQELK